MAKKTLKTDYECFENIEELTAPRRMLLEKATAVLPEAYIPYSNFHVGAAILLQNGLVLSGTNQENAAYPMCLCAERVVLAAAHAQYPKIPIVALAVTVKNPKQLIKEPASPCGACRQVICEMEGKHQQDIELIMRGEEGDILVFASAKDILPFGFNQSFLEEKLD